MNRFRNLLSHSSCAATAWRSRCGCTSLEARCASGEAVQVDPIKTTLKPPETKRLKLKYDKLLSSFAFNFNLRRHTVVLRAGRHHGLQRHGVWQGLTLVQFQLNLSCFDTKYRLHTPQYPLIPPKQPRNAPPIPQKALKFSRKVDECKPLVSGAFWNAAGPSFGTICFGWGHSLCCCCLMISDCLSMTKCVEQLGH